MSQNSLRLSWSFAEVDERLKGIMVGIYRPDPTPRAKKFGFGDNYVAGANIAGFKKVATSMLAHGVV